MLGLTGTALASPYKSAPDLIRAFNSLESHLRLLAPQGLFSMTGCDLCRLCLSATNPFLAIPDWCHVKIY